MSKLSLENILAEMADTGAVTSKTAADSSNTEASMLEVVRSLTENTKTAAAAQSGDAVAALQKIAADNAAAEDYALVKQAQLLGASMCDGFMSRLGGYDSAVAEKVAFTPILAGALGGIEGADRDQSLKGALIGGGQAAFTAPVGALGGALAGAVPGALIDHYTGSPGIAAGSLAGVGAVLGGHALPYHVGKAYGGRYAHTPEEEAALAQAVEAGKVAAYTEDQLKLAYAQGMADFEKQAADDYAQGQEDALQEIHKIASDVHFAGQQSAANVLAALASAGNS